LINGFLPICGMLPDMDIQDRLSDGFLPGEAGKRRKTVIDSDDETIRQTGD